MNQYYSRGGYQGRRNRPTAGALDAIFVGGGELNVEFVSPNGEAKLGWRRRARAEARAPLAAAFSWCRFHMPVADAPPVSRLTFRTHDLDEACSSVGESFYPHRLYRLNSSGDLDVAAKVYRLPKLELGRLTWGNDVRVQCADLQVAYHVNLPTSGNLDSECGPAEVRATPALAAVYNPVGRTTLHHADASCDLLTVKMERHALENELCERLGRPIRTPVSFQGHLPVMAGLGRDWVKLVKSLVDILDDTECNLLNDSLVARHLEESIIAGFLVAARHSHSDELATPASPCRPRHVKRAIDLIEQRPDEPWTVNELARVVGVRARTLQEGFQQHVGTPPMMYLRTVRLDRAHEELETSDVVDTTVAQIAYKWGFSHLGYFAGEYRKKYGVKPSETLRAS